MAGSKAGGLRDYNEVQERVAGFHEKYPNGAINTITIQTSIDNHIAVHAKVWKERPGYPDLPPDGTGLSWLSVPGKTNFTRGSELENAETSAVGRALAFIGFYAKGESLASKQEISAKLEDAREDTAEAGETDKVEWEGTPRPTQVEEGASAGGAVVGTPSSADPESEIVGKQGLTTKQVNYLFLQLRKANVPDDKRKWLVHKITGKYSVKDMTSEDLDLVLEFVKDGKWQGEHDADD